MTPTDRGHGTAGLALSQSPSPSSSPAPVRPAGQRSGEGATSVLPGLHDDDDRRPQPAGVPTERPGAQEGTSNRRIGRYLVSPLVKGLDNGWFATSVSIRSGRGSATTDSVLRFTRLFRCAQEAAMYARAEAQQWIAAAQPSLRTA